MFKRFLPTEYCFYDYFEKHIQKTILLAEEFLKMTKDPELLKESQKNIKLIESDLDSIVLECTEALHKTFITPIERTEIYRLIQKQDDIADSISSAVKRISMYEINDMRKETILIGDIIVKAAKELQSAVMMLRDMKNSEKIRELCKNVRKIESEGDKIFRDSITELFRSNDAVYIIKWKEVLERLEKAVNKCQDTANIIEEIIIDNA